MSAGFKDIFTSQYAPIIYELIQKKLLQLTIVNEAVACNKRNVKENVFPSLLLLLYLFIRTHSRSSRHIIVDCFNDIPAAR